MGRERSDSAEVIKCLIQDAGRKRGRFRAGRRKTRYRRIATVLSMLGSACEFGRMIHY